MSAPLVTVAIVTFNSARYLRQCLRYLSEQEYPAVEIVVIDNVSTDGTTAILHEFEAKLRVVYNKVNNGFAGGQNQAIALAEGAWVLTLNPDVRLASRFISELVAAGERDPAVGTVCGKLLSMAPDFALPTKPLIDSTGIYFTSNLRHFDRGSGQPDTGEFDRSEYVFGATGAAALYRKAMIKDVSLPGGFFDAAFFAYREDADVAWRAQLLGWKCIYTPDAIGFHVRSVLPSNRGSLPALINMHSVKNRFLMRINNITGRLYRRLFWPVLLRDALVVAGCLLRERTSLRAFTFILRHWRTAWHNRQFVMSRRRGTEEYMEHWFTKAPVDSRRADQAQRRVAAQ